MTPSAQPEQALDRIDSTLPCHGMRRSHCAGDVQSPDG